MGVCVVGYPGIKQNSHAFLYRRTVRCPYESRAVLEEARLQAEQ